MPNCFCCAPLICRVVMACHGKVSSSASRTSVFENFVIILIICNALVASASLSSGIALSAFSPGHGTSRCIRRGKSAKRPDGMSKVHADLRSLSDPRRCAEHLLRV